MPAEGHLKCHKENEEIFFFEMKFVSISFHFRMNFTDVQNHFENLITRNTILYHGRVLMLRYGLRTLIVDNSKLL